MGVVRALNSKFAFVENWYQIHTNNVYVYSIWWSRKCGFRTIVGRTIVKKWALRSPILRIIYRPFPIYVLNVLYSFELKNLIILMWHKHFKVLEKNKNVMEMRFAEILWTINLH